MSVFDRSLTDEHSQWGNFVCNGGKASKIRAGGHERRADSWSGGRRVDDPGDKSVRVMYTYE